MILTEREIVQSIEVGLILYFFCSICLHAVNYIKQSILKFGLKVVILTMFGIVYALPLLIMAYYIVSDHHMLSANILLTLFQTNVDEVRSYLVEQNIIIWSATGLAAICIICSMLWTISSFKIKNSVKCFVINFILAIMAIIILLPKLNSNFIINMYAKVMDTIEEYEQYQNTRLERQAKLNKLKNLFYSDNEPQLHILVIGEATVRDHMSTFGYRQLTTPWLDDLKQKEKNVFVFSNAYSNNVQTVMAVQQALTSQNQYNKQDLTDAISLTEAANVANYDTFWISNQQHYNMHDTPITVIASATDKQIYINDYVGKKLRTTYYDEKLADYFPQIKENSKTFIIFHLMGCHNVYSDRYPPQFMYFTHSDDERINQYDDCVRYNDYVLSLLYRKAVANKNFMSFTFLSDHGEDPDAGLTHDYSKFTWNMTHIPLVIIVSDKYAQKNIQTITALSENINQYWTSDFLYELMLHILGINTQTMLDDNYDLASINYTIEPDTLTIISGEKFLKDDIAENIED